MLEKQTKYIALMAAKKNNRCIPNKNIIKLGDKPLMSYSLIAANKSKYINKIFLTTNCDKIADIGREFNATIIDRPIELTTPTSNLLDVYIHGVKFIEENYNIKSNLILLLQGNSPIINYKMIDDGFQFMLSHKNYDSYVSVSNFDKFHPSRAFKIVNNKLLPSIEYNHITSNRPSNSSYFCDGAMFIIRRDNLDKPNNKILCQWLGRNIKPVIREYTTDVDDYFDLEMLKYVLKRGNDGVYRMDSR